MLAALSAAELEKFAAALRLTLEEACAYPLPDIDNTNRGQPFTVRERVEDTVKELRWQCDNEASRMGAAVEPEIVVLAGGGCRLPLIAEEMRKAFPPPPGGEDRLVFQADVAKQRVAHGMASYLALRRANRTFVEGVANSVEVIHHDLGLQQVSWDGSSISLRFTPVVRVGERTHAPERWHPFTFEPSQVNSEGGSRRLLLYLQDWRRGPREFGYFDLARAVPPAEGDGPFVAEPLPATAEGPFAAEMRLRRAREGEREVQKIEARFQHQGQWYGPYPLVPSVADPESMLHG